MQRPPARGSFDLGGIMNELRLLKVYDGTLVEADELRRQQNSPRTSSKNRKTSPARYLDWYNNKKPAAAAAGVPLSSSPRNTGGDTTRRPTWRFSTAIPDRKTSSGGYPTSNVGYNKATTSTNNKNNNTLQSTSPPIAVTIPETIRTLRHDIEEEIKKENLAPYRTTSGSPWLVAPTRGDPTRPSTPVREVVKPTEGISLYRPATASHVMAMAPLLSADSRSLSRSTTTSNYQPHHANPACRSHPSQVSATQTHQSTPVRRKTTPRGV